jgi:CHRD domain
MRNLYPLLIAGLLGLALSGVAHAQGQAPTTYVAKLSAENDVPGCASAVENGAHGVAIVQIDAETGVIDYRVVATQLPGTIAGSAGAHIHIGAAGEAGPVVAPLLLTGRERGVIAEGTVTNAALAAAILADPAGYYVNVHTTLCPDGAVRGQLG